MNKTQNSNWCGEQIAVTCPSWLKRKIVRSLEETAQDRVNRVCAKKATAILESTDT